MLKLKLNKQIKIKKYENNILNENKEKKIKTNYAKLKIRQTKERIK